MEIVERFSDPDVVRTLRLLNARLARSDELTP
jgi:hypothetical protein